jgi:membrane fusion protein (multidrug efflux system)
MRLTTRTGSILLFLALVTAAALLAAWKRGERRETEAAAAAQPEPVEVVSAATASERSHRASTTAIGTVLALRSVTLQNELAGTVRSVALVPGAVVEEGTLLVGLDVAVEEAELAAQAAQAALAETLLGRMQRALENRGASEADVDRARAERDVALAQVARTRAVIERKTVRAPFRARVGLADVHPGQYLDAGSELTTLQGLDPAVHVDFSVPQEIAATLAPGATVALESPPPGLAAQGTIEALDARVDATTRSVRVRQRVEVGEAPAPGAAVRVRVPIGPARTVVTVPVSALRKGPTGDHLYVLGQDAQGALRVAERTVLAGPVLGDEVVIESGLSAGERVATSGSFKLRDGALASVIETPR